MVQNDFLEPLTSTHISHMARFLELQVFRKIYHQRHHRLCRSTLRRSYGLADWLGRSPRAPSDHVCGMESFAVCAARRQSSCVPRRQFFKKPYECMQELRMSLLNDYTIPMVFFWLRTSPSKRGVLMAGFKAYCS